MSCFGGFRKTGELSCTVETASNKYKCQSTLPLSVEAGALSGLRSTCSGSSLAERREAFITPKIWGVVGELTQAGSILARLGRG